MIIAPGLALQKLTTRKPDDDQIEVAIDAMQAALVADGEAVGEESVAAPGSLSRAPASP